MFRFPVFLMAVALIATGCNALQTDDLAEGFTVPEGEPIPMGQVDAPPDSPHFLTHGDPRKTEAGREMFSRAVEALAAADAILKSEQTLSEKDAAMREVYAMDLPRESRWAAITSSGMNMLRLLLADPTSDPEAIGYYAGLLTEYRNPNADVLLAAFDRLDGTWTEARLAEARQQAAEGALDWLQRSGCATCATAEGLRAYTQPGANLDTRNGKIADALSRLTRG